MMLTYRYRVLPSKRQHRSLERILESQRQLYNAALEERIDAYRKVKVKRAYIDQCRALTEWRQSDSEASSLPVTLQRWTLKRLDDAYHGFFRRLQAGQKPGFPRFRGKSRFDSFGFREFRCVHFREGRIRFKGMQGGLRIYQHRPLPEDCIIKSCVFRRDVRGWTVSLEACCPEISIRPANRMVGIDLGISTFAALSDGGFIPSLKAARRAQRRLRVAQRSLSRKARGSGGRLEARIRVTRCHAATARARANHLHQASARLVRDYDRIAVERLNLKGLARGALAKDVHDAAWAKFISMLRYKAACAGAQLIEVSSYNTSQGCSGCGAISPKKLDDRLHVCNRCGLAMDRDLNAARNILYRAGMGPGLRNAADCGTRAGGNLEDTVGALQRSLHGIRDITHGMIPGLTPSKNCR